MNKSSKASFAICLISAGSAIAAPAEGRIGEGLIGFQKKVAKFYKSKGDLKKEDRTYYRYALLLDQQTLLAAPNFGIGLTVTGVDGKVVGESMVIRLGDNYEAGKMLAVAHTLDFVNEALGRPAPKNQQAASDEFGALAVAVDQALSGVPQNIRYPGFTTRIKVSRAPEGDLLLAATPDLSIDALKQKTPEKPAAEKGDAEKQGAPKKDYSPNSL